MVNVIEAISAPVMIAGRVRPPDARLFENMFIPSLPAARLIGECGEIKTLKLIDIF